METRGQKVSEGRDQGGPEDTSRGLDEPKDSSVLLQILSHR